MAKTARPPTTPATKALAAAGVPYRVHVYAFAPGTEGIGLQAAAALNVEPARLLKTLVVTVDDADLAMALLAVDRDLDLKAAAQALGGKRAAMAPIPAAERATGYVKGGISPFGQRRRLPAVVDQAALAFPQLIVNGGRRGVQVELASGDLVRLVNATVAPLGSPV